MPVLYRGSAVPKG